MTHKIQDIEEEIILKEVDGYDDQEPYAIFIKNEQPNNYKYKVRIIAFIPLEVKDSYKIEFSEGKERIKTPFGELTMRSIYLSWENNIKPADGPHTLLSITIQYTPENDSEDKGIKVKYKFGLPGPSKPKTSRGTVTTSSDPCE